jgi:RNA polymerase sigma factor (sigma-70 family)
LETERWNHIGQGNIEAYSETYIFYYKKLFNYGRKFTDDTALIEDGIQVVFVMIWNNREKFVDISSPHSYIFYSFRNYIFKEKKKQQKVVFQNKEPEFSIDNILIDKETTADLNKRLQVALISLTSRQREAIFLRFYEALSFEEVAQIMNISVKATYKLITRSLLKLKELLNTPKNPIIRVFLKKRNPQRG